MEWQKIYKEKISTADNAVKAIKSNDFVVISHAASVPEIVISAMIRRKDLRNVQIYHMLSLGAGEYMAPEMKENFRHITNFVGGNSRKAILENRADFFPFFFKDVPSLFENTVHVDAAIIQVTPPDKEGYCSFGVSCDYTKAAAEKASIVIAETNDIMPHIGGNNKIHVSDIDYIIPCAKRLPEISQPVISDIEKMIGKHCSSLINDGATLQLGIGAIPDAVLLFLKDKNDLGIHTEMFSDGAVDLIKDGIINGKKKTIHKEKHIATFLMGTSKLYDFVDFNQDIELYPVNYVNDPYIIAQNNNMVSVNSCIEVDIMGQVVSESMGLKQFSGIGGQIDYIRGAALSKGGKSIIAIPSTAAKGSISRIVPFLAQGSSVTTSRNDVDYIVTEYGIAKLKGKTLRERAANLIEIAHPDFRKDLKYEYDKRFKTN